jgi:hypothetical protein
MFYKITRGLAWLTFICGGVIMFLRHGAFFERGMLVVALSTLILITAHPSPEEY